MAALLPFRALRPRPADAPRIAAVPYDVVTTDEARRLAADNPLSFLRVSRPELELPPGSDPYGAEVYARAARNFAALRASSLELEGEPSLYVYRLRMGAHIQTGIAGCFPLDDYERDVIKKHERTRRDKEDDRTRHMWALRAQTGPVFLTYRASPAVDARVAGVTSGRPLFDFTAVDGVQHTMWQVSGAGCDAIVAAFRDIRALYIADGHHRAASAARTRTELRAAQTPTGDLGDGADYNSMLAVAFPHDQVQVLPYHRVVKDLAGLSPDAFLRGVREVFAVSPGTATPEGPGRVSMYFQGRWHTLQPHVAPDPSDPIGSLDVSVLQDRLLAPVLRIADVRSDPRIDFVGGIRGTGFLEDLVSQGRAAVAFSMCPVSVSDLISVADAGAIMPPKSTWFEPKLRDGLLIHVI
ncbi:MAG: DUF1015 domain-containing protein [Vicinamibacterales bacterium]